MYHPAAPVLEYHKNLANICCLSSLTSDFHSTEDNRDVTTLWNCIELLLELNTGKFRNRTNFANYIMTNRILIKVEQHLRSNAKIRKKGKG